MRYREEELLRIYKKEEAVPRNSHILWIDSCTLFPYKYDKAEVFISLDGENIVHSRELLQSQKLYINIGNLAVEARQNNWIKAKLDKYRNVSGIPVIFPNFRDLEKVQAVTCSWVFTYRNAKGERNKIVIHTISNIIFNPAESSNEYRGKDYLLSDICTSIPTLLEKNDIEERIRIMENYEEIYQGKAELNVRKRWEIPLYASVIKSGTQTREEEALSILNRVIDYLLARNLLDNCDNVFLNVFFDNDKRLLQPMMT